MSTDRSLLRVEELSCSFGGLRAVNRVSFQVSQGVIKSLIGPNGAGKTTVLNLLSGFIRPDEGRVTLAGRDITGLPPHRVTAMGLARTFQNVRLFGNMTALENVMIGQHVRSRSEFVLSLLKLPRVWQEERRIEQRARELLAQVGLEHRADQLARDLTFADERRLEIARALAAEPKLLLLDEPAAGLNQREAAALAGLMLAVRDSGVSLLLIEHNVRLVMQVSDEVMVLHFGEKIADGTPDEVAADPTVARAYLGSTGVEPTEVGAS